MKNLIGIYFLVFCIFVFGVAGRADNESYNEIEIYNIAPFQGTKGTVMTITGKGFGDNAGKVNIGCGECIVEEWGDTELTCKYWSLKNRAGTYDVVVTTAFDETIVIEDGYELMAPEVNPISKGYGVVGNKIDVTGKYFGTKHCDFKVLGVFCQCHC